MELQTKARVYTWSVNNLNTGAIMSSGEAGDLKQARRLAIHYGWEHSKTGPVRALVKLGRDWRLNIKWSKPSHAQ